MKTTYYKKKDKKLIDQFLLNNHGHLLQSFLWGEFQSNESHRVYNIGVEDKGEILIYAQIIVYYLPLKKSYLYIPRGPVFNSSNYAETNKNVMAILLNEVKAIAKKENSIFLKIEPEVRNDSEESRLYVNLKFKQSAKKIQPVDTLIIDIGKDEDQILKSMHHKTRYNIRLAGRKGISVRSGKGDQDIDSFYDLMIKTTRRDNFKPHSKKYYHNQLKTLGKENLIKLYLAEKDNQVVAGIIVTFWGKRATYLHGALDSKYRKYMGPHLLQWEAIQDAVERGCEEYDMWGIAPQKHDEDHPWTGITRFKTGFGGEKLHLTGSLDLIYQKVWYEVYKTMSSK